MTKSGITQKQGKAQTLSQEEKLSPITAANAEEDSIIELRWTSQIVQSSATIDHHLRPIRYLR